MKEREESIKEGDIESAISLLQSDLAIEDVANIYNLTMEELKLRLEKL
jgi:DNA polymerase III delta prime subunit